MNGPTRTESIILAWWSLALGGMLGDRAGEFLGGGEATPEGNALARLRAVLRRWPSDAIESQDALRMRELQEFVTGRATVSPSETIDVWASRYLLWRLPGLEWLDATERVDYLAVWTPDRIVERWAYALTIDSIDAIITCGNMVLELMGFGLWPPIDVSPEPGPDVLASIGAGLESAVSGLGDVIAGSVEGLGAGLGSLAGIVAVAVLAAGAD